MRWGFAGKDDAAPTRPRHMHARRETIERLPTFKHAFANARGIMFVHTFNEGGSEFSKLPHSKAIVHEIYTPVVAPPTPPADNLREGYRLAMIHASVTVPELNRAGPLRRP